MMKPFDTISRKQTFFKKVVWIYRLYIWWQYQLGILPKGCTYKPTSPYMNEELRHLEAIDTETRYLAQNKIETMAALKQDMKATQRESLPFTAICPGMTGRTMTAIPSTIRRFMEMNTLTGPLLKELIDHIDVYEMEGSGKSKTQRIAIYYRFVGYIELPDGSYFDHLREDVHQGVSVEYIPEKAKEQAVAC